MKSKGLKMLIGLMTIGLMIAIPSLTQATPGANVLITDNPNHQVIEVDPLTGNVVWEYGGTGTLNYPNEAIPLTNGNILIADTYNGRVIEVESDTQGIVWQYPPGYTPTFRPVDIKKCIDYTTGTPRDTLLIVDGNRWNSRVIEITYPDGDIVWEFLARSIGGIDDYLFWEAEKRPGMGTPTYLITSRGTISTVIEVERTGPTAGIFTWAYHWVQLNNPLNDPRDANWLPCGNVLITDTDNKRVIEVDQATNNIVWQYGPYEDYIPLEAIRIENLNTLIAGIAPANPGYWDDNKDGRYPDQQWIENYTDIREIQGTSTIVWDYKRWYPGSAYGIIQTRSAFVDVEEKGIINIAKIMYEDMRHKGMPITFAGVIVPIYQPEIIMVGTPTIVATKTVTPTGPQTPGATLTYTVWFKNTGEGTATNVVVIDQVPEGTEYVLNTTTPMANEFSHDGGQTYDTSEALPVTHLKWNIGELAPGEERRIIFQVRIQ